MSNQRRSATRTISQRPTSTSKTQLRQAEILRRLAGGDTVTVTTLAKEFGVSLATVRRDLSTLGESEGVARTYGGATLVRPPVEKSMVEREVDHPEAKNAIGRLAAGFVADGDLVVLDAGSTTEAVAVALHGRPIQVVTNGVCILQRLASSENTQIIVLGGVFRGFNQTITGPDASAMLSRVYGQSCFIGADAVHPERGVGTRAYEQSHLKSLMMTRADQVFIVADSSKLVDAPFPHWSPLPKHWTLITDSSATEAQLEPYRNAGATIVTPGQEEG